MKKKKKIQIKQQDWIAQTLLKLNLLEMYIELIYT